MSVKQVRDKHYHLHYNVGTGSQHQYKLDHYGWTVAVGMLCHDRCTYSCPLVIRELRRDVNKRSKEALQKAQTGTKRTVSIGIKRKIASKSY